MIDRFYLTALEPEVWTLAVIYPKNKPGSHQTEWNNGKKHGKYVSEFHSDDSVDFHQAADLNVFDFVFVFVHYTFSFPCCLSPLCPS